MKRLHVQIPDDLYHRLAQIAAKREWTLTELVRRSLERETEQGSIEGTSEDRWRLPSLSLGKVLASPEQIRDLVQREAVRE